MNLTERAARLELLAQEHAVRVRDEDPEAVGRWLVSVIGDDHDREEWRAGRVPEWVAYCQILAAAVPDDRTWRELTAWIAHPGCGTTAGYYRHYTRGEKPCASCRAAKAEYERRRVA